MHPARGMILVRPVETDDLQRGIVWLAESRERLTQLQCEVIAVGEPALCEDEECERAHHLFPIAEYDARRWALLGRMPRVHPCAVRAGAWLLVRPRSFIEGPTPERKEWFVHQDDVLAILNED